MLAQMERMKQAAYRACLAEVETHLDGFLRKHSGGTYEQWIGELHPENLRINAFSGEKSVDHRFYIEGSDHLRLWNARVDSRRSVRVQAPLAAHPVGNDFGGRPRQGTQLHTESCNIRPPAASPLMYERTTQSLGCCSFPPPRRAYASVPSAVPTWIFPPDAICSAGIIQSSSSPHVSFPNFNANPASFTLPRSDLHQEPLRVPNGNTMHARCYVPAEGRPSYPSFRPAQSLRVRVQPGLHPAHSHLPFVGLSKVPPRPPVQGSLQGSFSPLVLHPAHTMPGSHVHPAGAAMQKVAPLLSHVTPIVKAPAQHYLPREPLATKCPNHA